MTIQYDGPSWKVKGQPWPSGLISVNVLLGYIYQEKSLNKIYDVVTENIFDMSNVRIFKEIGKKKNGGCLYFVMSSVSWAQ